MVSLESKVKANINYEFKAQFLKNVNMHICLNGVVFQESCMYNTHWEFHISKSEAIECAENIANEKITGFIH